MRGHLDDWICWDGDSLQPAGWGHWRYLALVLSVWYCLSSLQRCWTSPCWVSCPGPPGSCWSPPPPHNHCFRDPGNQKKNIRTYNTDITIHNLVILPTYFLNKSRAAGQGEIWCPALCFVDCDLTQIRGGWQLHMWVRPTNIRHYTSQRSEAWRQNFLLFACCETSTPALSIVLWGSESRYKWLSNKRTSPFMWGIFL